MDERLVAWARAVKARGSRASGTGASRRGQGASGAPPLWLFTDPVRQPDLLAAIAALPAGLCGVVFRHDGVPDRAGLLRAVARVCRARRLALVVAGGGAVPAGAGRHLREGRGVVPARGLSTSSAHGRAGLVRARRARVSLAFLSPAFVTRSHAVPAPLGPVRWGLVARRAGLAVAALGGVTGRSVRCLPDFVENIGAIDALSVNLLSLGSHTVPRLPCAGSVHDCELKKGAAILRSGLADP